jgi:hypothetical protein
VDDDVVFKAIDEWNLAKLHENVEQAVDRLVAGE